jgi:hypothetical protein
MDRIKSGSKSIVLILSILLILSNSYASNSFTTRPGWWSVSVNSWACRL